MNGRRLLPRVARTARWRVPVAVSVAAHAALLAMAWTAWQAGQPTSASVPSVVVRMIEWVAPATPEPVAEPEQVRRTDSVSRTERRPANRSPVNDDPAAPSDEDAEPASPAGDVPVNAAPSTTPTLDPDSIQRAARQAARSRSLVQQSNELIGTKPPPSAQEQLGAQVARSAKGDCLKGGEGGYEKQNFGLLAIPFLIVDAATGNCRK